jgi:uncharacterized protein (TIGR02444 family)
MTVPPADLWSAVQAIYERPGVAAACLALQDEHGADVVLLLFLCARAARGEAVDARQIARLNAAIRPWRAATIAPLRGLRRDLATPPPGFETGTLRRLIATAEIEAERLQLVHLDGLIAAAASPRPAADAAAASLHAYAEEAGIPVAALHELLALFAAAPAP